MSQIGKIFFTVLFISLVFTACRSDDSNPAEPKAPESVGTYSGHNILDTTMSITIGNVGGKAFVTSYSINYKIVSGSSTTEETYGNTDSDGLAEVVNNSFSVSLGSNNDEVFTGTISGNTMTGGFKFPSIFLVPEVSGTYTLTKSKVFLELIGRKIFPV